MRNTVTLVDVVCAVTFWRATLSCHNEVIMHWINNLLAVMRIVQGWIVHGKPNHRKK
jgi:hypothetical protein